MTSTDVTFHEDSLFFSSPSLSPTPAIASLPPGFSPHMVFHDPLPLVLSPPPFLSSPFRCVSFVLPTFSTLDRDPLSSSIVSLPSLDASPPTPRNDLHLPIALRKGTRVYTRRPISHFAFYNRLAPSFRAFALSVASESIPRLHVEAAQVHAWRETIDSKLEALVSRRTWTLVPRPKNANIVTCKCVFTLKYYPDDTITHHKACLVARGFT